MRQNNEDFTDLLESAKKNVQFGYLEENYSISKDVQRDCEVGLVKKWKHPLTFEEYSCITIPHSKTSYLAIDITGEHGYEHIGNTSPFNVKRGLEADFPFVVRDAISAMSVMTAGGGALALCTDDVSSIVDILKKSTKKKSMFHICAE